MNIFENPNKTLLDVREPLELQIEGEVPQAINIPMGQIQENLEQIKQFSTPIIVFCRSGNRSGKVMEYLKQQGLEDVYNGGGFTEVLENI